MSHDDPAFRQPSPRSVPRGETLAVSVLADLNDVDAADWDACAGEANPFVRHAFLSALEDSGSVGPGTGWRPQHLVIPDHDGTLVAVAPLYLKNHSYGEYVFDWSWANAYEQAGGRYYPKLQGAVPFTPVTGPRLLVRPDAPDPAHLRRALLAAMVQLAERAALSSVHVTFPTREDADVAVGMGFLHRQGQQYHWENQGYRDFQDFLDTLASRKRKTIRKERERANGHGVTLQVLTGDDLTPHHWRAFYQFYLSTADRKWGRPYLTEDFFQILGERMADRVALVMGTDDDSGQFVCGALNLIGSDALYGRNWGALAEYKDLHFEACYYRAMDFAIAHGLRWVEAGAQGEHKIQRGYLPQATHSVHWIAEPGFRAAVARFVEQERAMVSEDMAALTAFGPYRRGDRPEG
ncbi:GNAT family N-acetyltransferase [Roseospira navarrensis]|uniref:GNAT family N-acetyltransferase n=1 Tax=Roseospira navarrensis TaxID=140058 RepID=A0A7X1ZB40_9PROT|nr:GNAT family N-acetyltransferase [Roseospira navarrensis]MQX35285.1 GNAT family N-acetyltransferase [Roseospira navarrensis]